MIPEKVCEGRMGPDKKGAFRVAQYHAHDDRPFVAVPHYFKEFLIKH